MKRKTKLTTQQRNKIGAKIIMDLIRKKDIKNLKAKYSARNIRALQLRAIIEAKHHDRVKAARAEVVKSEKSGEYLMKTRILKQAVTDLMLKGALNWWERYGNTHSRSRYF